MLRGVELQLRSASKRLSLMLGWVSCEP